MTLRHDAKPAPLVAAASLAAVEGVVLVALAVLELFSLDPERIAVGVTTTVFFAGYGVVLLLCAWAVTHGRSWARSPIVLAQLIQLGIAWSFRGGDTTVLAIAIAVVALVVLAGLFTPASIDALSGRDEDEERR